MAAATAEALWWLPEDAHETPTDRVGLQAEVDRLNAENVTLRAHLDEASAARDAAVETERERHRGELAAMQAKLDAAEQARLEAFDDGKQEGIRLRGVPSIFGR